MPIRSVVPLARQEDFDEVGQHDQFVVLARRMGRHHGDRSKGGFRGFAAWHEVAVQNAFGDLGQRKLGHRSAQMPFQIPQLEPSSQDHVESRAGNHPHLPGERHRPSQSPIRYGDSHSPLDDDWLTSMQHGKPL